MIKEDMLVAYGDHVIVEDTGVDGIGRLLQENNLVGMNTMPAPYGLEALQRLACGEKAWLGLILVNCASAINKEMQTPGITF